MAIKTLKKIIRRLFYFQYYSKFKGEARNVILAHHGYIINPEEIEFGKNVFIGRGFHISANKLIIGSNIMIGPNVLIECSNHRFNIVGENIFSYSNQKLSKGITIEDDVWIGGNVTILDGVMIGEGCVVGASSTVVKSLPPYTICVGSPCVPIKKRFDDNSLKEHILLVTSKYDVNSIIEKRNQIFNNETTHPEF